MEPSSEQSGSRTIADVAAHFDVSYRTLRFYEQMGLVHPRRSKTRRFYSDQDVATIAVILQGRKLGFSLASIAGMLSAKAAVDNAADDFVDLVDPASLKMQIAELERRRDQIISVLDELSAKLRISLGKQSAARPPASYRVRDWQLRVRNST